MSIKGSIELFIMTHNNREVSYIIPEEQLSHIAIFLSCFIIFFDFTTPLLIWCTFCQVPSHTSPSSFSILILSFSLYYTCQSPSLSLTTKKKHILDGLKPSRNAKKPSEIDSRRFFLDGLKLSRNMRR
jgi:hypothetical protein